MLPEDRGQFHNILEPQPTTTGTETTTTASPTPIHHTNSPPPHRFTKMSAKMAGLNAILRWTIEHGHKEDAPAGMPSYAESMSEERKAWLKEALENMSNYEDVIDIVAKRLQGLDEDGTTPLPMSDLDLVAAQESTLEEMLCVIDNIDFARDFGKIGGAEALLTLLDSPHAGLRWRSAEVVATVVQNNPACQQMMLEKNLLGTLMNLVESDLDATTRTKAFLGISSQVRGHPASLDLFLKKGGVDIMLQALERDDTGTFNGTLVRKVLFLIPGIVFMRPTFCNVGKSSGLLDQCLMYSMWGVVKPGKKNGERETKEGGDEGQDGREHAHGALRETALKAALSLASGTGGIEALDVKRKLVERRLRLNGLTGDEKMYVEDEMRLLGEVVSAK